MAGMDPGVTEIRRDVLLSTDPVADDPGTLTLVGALPDPGCCFETVVSLALVFGTKECPSV